MRQNYVRFQAFKDSEILISKMYWDLLGFQDQPNIRMISKILLRWDHADFPFFPNPSPTPIVLDPPAFNFRFVLTPTIPQVVNIDRQDLLTPALSQKIKMLDVQKVEMYKIICFEWFGNSILVLKYLCNKWGVQSPTCCRNLKMSKNANKNIGNHV